MIRWFIAGLGLAGIVVGCATKRPGPLTDLSPVLLGDSGRFERLLASPASFRLQVLISEVVPIRHGGFGLKRHGYRVDAEYFYPASAIKLCAAVAALEVIEHLQPRVSSVDLADVPIDIAPHFPGDDRQVGDISNLAGGAITVGHELRKLALVSDNQAFNRCFDLVGHAELNRSMHSLGLGSVVINHRLAETRPLANDQASAAVTFRPANRDPLLVPARRSALRLQNRAKGLLVGDAYLAGDRLVSAPMDFTRRNGISLVDLQDLLVKVARPDIDLGTPRLRLSPAHRARLLRAMEEYPRESANPLYPEQDFPDEYSKFLLPGIRRVFPATGAGERIESVGKVGRAYGFSIENVYVRNPQNGRALFVTATIYTNADGVLNDDRYEYVTVADPFFADLGELLARQWLGGSPSEN